MLKFFSFENTNLVSQWNLYYSLNKKGKKINESALTKNEVMMFLKHVSFDLFELEL